MNWLYDNFISDFLVIVIQWIVRFIGEYSIAIILSMLLVLFVLPQILLIGGNIVDRTSFSVRHAVKKEEAHGRVFVDGVVSGEIHGSVSGIMRANIDGDVDLRLISGSVTPEDQPSDTPPEPPTEEAAEEPAEEMEKEVCGHEA